MGELGPVPVHVGIAGPDPPPVRRILLQGELHVGRGLPPQALGNLPEPQHELGQRLVGVELEAVLQGLLQGGLGVVRRQHQPLFGPGLAVHRGDRRRHPGTLVGQRVRALRLFLGVVPAVTVWVGRGVRGILAVQPVLLLPGVRQAVPVVVAHAHAHLPGVAVRAPVAVVDGQAQGVYALLVVGRRPVHEQGAGVEGGPRGQGGRPGVHVEHPGILELDLDLVALPLRRGGARSEGEGRGHVGHRDAVGLAVGLVVRGGRTGHRVAAIVGVGVGDGVRRVRGRRRGTGAIAQVPGPVNRIPGVCPGTGEGDRLAFIACAHSAQGSDVAVGGCGRCGEQQEGEQRHERLAEGGDRR